MHSLPLSDDAVIGANLRILAHVMSDSCLRSTLEEISGGTITANQFAILRILHKRQQLTASEFARLLRISNAAVSKNIDRLVALGLVARGAHPSDRRSASLELQPSGRALLAHYDAVSHRKLSGILAEFSDEEKPQLLAFLQRIIRHTLSDAQDVDIICYQCGGRCGEACVIEHRHGTCSLLAKEGD